MGVGQRLKTAMERHGVTQKQVAERLHMTESAVSKIVNEKRRPEFDTVERMVMAIGTTWGDLFNEPRISLTAEDAGILHDSIPALRDCVPILERLLVNDAMQKEAAATQVEARPPRRRRRKTGEHRAPAAPLRPGIGEGAVTHHEVQNAPSAMIPPWAYRMGARRAFTVHTDSMIGAGILDGVEIYVRMTTYTDAADGDIIVCSLNGSTYLKRLDRRSRQISLESANPRYPTLDVTGADDFTMIGVVVMKPETE